MDDEAVSDIFSAFGPVRIRPMFGGKGIFREGLMFALVAGDAIYLKADSQTADIYRTLGSRPFSYGRSDGRSTSLNYWLMPETALEDPDEAARLAGLSFAAALRSRSRGKRRKPSPIPDSSS
jgi:DNA transformation protein